MASLYEQLMASKGAPKADAAPNSTQLRKAPVSLRSAMRKYAMGGDVEGQGFEGESPLQGGNLSAGLAKAIQSGGPMGGNLMQILQQIAAQQAQQGTPQGMSPPPPERPSTNDFDRFKQDIAPPRPEDIPPRPRVPDLETPFIAPTTPQGPRTSYRQNDDGSLEEIGYDDQPISNYTPEQTAMDRATRGLDPSEYRYVWNGQGYDKVPTGGQTGGQINYRPDPEENVPPPPPEDPRETPRFYEPDPEPVYQPPEDPGFYQPPEEPSYYQPPVYDNPTPIGVAKSLERGGDLGKLLQDLASSGRTGGDLGALIAKALAGGGGGGSLEEQRKLMALLEMLKGR
jgi:hypothetical protein